jgi:hypothetical protein
MNKSTLLFAAMMILLSAAKTAESEDVQLRGIASNSSHGIQVPGEWKLCHREYRAVTTALWTLRNRLGCQWKESLT